MRCSVLYSQEAQFSTVVLRPTEYASVKLTFKHLELACVIQEIWYLTVADAGALLTFFKLISNTSVVV